MHFMAVSLWKRFCIIHLQFDNGNYYYYGLLERIGEEAFYGCSSMEYAYVHSTVKEVGARAFREAGVTKADWYTAAPVPDGCFESCGELTAFNVNGGGHRIASIGDRAFYECGQVATVLWYSYRGSDGKNYLYYPYLERIGDEAFYGCAAATYAYLHTSVEQVGAGAFQGSGLTQTDWYTSARMPDSCFRDCVSLGTVGWGEEPDYGDGRTSVLGRRGPAGACHPGDGVRYGHRDVWRQRGQSADTDLSAGTAACMGRNKRTGRAADLCAGFR